MKVRYGSKKVKQAIKFKTTRKSKIAKLKQESKTVSKRKILMRQTPKLWHCDFVSPANYEGDIGL